MNIQTIILLIIIIAAAGLVLWRIFKQHSHKHGGCSYCDVEGCTLPFMPAHICRPTGPHLPPHRSASAAPPVRICRPTGPHLPPHRFANESLSAGFRQTG